jgi:hypothetical protein
MSGVVGSTRPAGGELRSPLEVGLVRGTCFSLSGERGAPLAGFHANRQISPASRRGVFGHEAEENSSGCGGRPAPRRAETCRGRYEWPNSRGELRSPDKLKHVPQCAARKLSAVSFQLSAFERHEIVAACKEYGGIVIQEGPTTNICATPEAAR